MRLILIGPPGSGKGTQAKLLSERFGLTHIATGDIFREAIRMGTSAGKMAEPYVSTGKLVPDEIVNELVADRFRRDDRPERFVMDGYPRTRAQATAFEQALGEQGLDVQAVLLLTVEDEEIVRRLSGRWSCPNTACKATFHETMRPPRIAGVCDNCKSKLIQRDDDREETVRRRLEVYHQNTAELIGYYRSKGLLHPVAGKGSIEAIYSQIAGAIKRAIPTC